MAADRGNFWSRLTVYDIQAADAGEFSVSAVNGFGTVTSSASLTLQGQARFKHLLILLVRRCFWNHSKFTTLYNRKGMKVKVWTLVIAPLTWVRLVTSSALQSRKWQLIGMSQWCRSALCGHPLPALTDNWTYGAASRHTIAPISHTRPSPDSHRYYSFPIPLRVGGWVSLSTQ